MMSNISLQRSDWYNLKPTIYGFGINDVNYKVTVKKVINGRQKQLWVCPYYIDWYNIIRRCFDNKFHVTKPTYIGCNICEEWRHFSNFIKWVDSQPNRDWQNCQPDKDILMYGNKHYGPETVVYVPAKLNTFVNDLSHVRGNTMIGAFCALPTMKNPYSARCSNPSTGKSEYIGLFPTELEAHKAWQAKKHEYACLLANQQQDPRVAKALRERYAPDKDWTNR